jgi:PPP family 3-phenylpropionic acid transporter
MTTTAAAAPRWVAWRLAGYYGAVFGAGGILLPFWPSWLGAQGLGASEIGVLLAAAMVARILATPLIARVADTTGERKRLIVLLGAASLGCWALFPAIAGFWMLLLVGVFAQGTTAASMPLTEDMTLGAVRAGGLQYGRIRLVGSITFLLAALLGGAWLTGRPSDHVLMLIIAGAVWVFVAALLLPDLRPTERLSIDLVGGLRTVLLRPGFVPLFLAAGLIQASHMVYYGFGTLQWRAAGLSDGFIGVLWAEGVIAEIALFWYAAALMRRIHPVHMMMLGGALGALRWLGTGATTAEIPLLVLQALHGISFGATHIGALHFLRERAPAGLTATAQGLYSALAMGMMGGLTMMASGPLVATLGAPAYYVMAAMCVAGAALAWWLSVPTRNSLGSPSA